MDGKTTPYKGHRMGIRSGEEDGKFILGTGHEQPHGPSRKRLLGCSLTDSCSGAQGRKENREAAPRPAATAMESPRQPPPA